MRLTLRAAACLAILAIGGRAHAGPIFAIDGGSANDVLVTVNTSTATITPIRPTGFPTVQGIAFAPDGSLFGIDQNTFDLLRINTTTGAATIVGNTEVFDLQGLAFDSSGTLFATDVTPNNLRTINPATGATTLVGSLGSNGITGLAFVFTELVQEMNPMLVGLRQNGRGRFHRRNLT